MKEYDENLDFDNDAEDEKSVGTGVIDGFDNYELEAGSLSFGMDKSEAHQIINDLFTMPDEPKTLSDIIKNIFSNTSYSYLTQDNIIEILNYGIEQELIRKEYDYYVRID